MADFKVQRGAATIAVSASSVSITAGVDYTAPSALSKAFIRLTSDDYEGNETVTATLPPDDSCAWISNPANLLTSITFSRTSTNASTGVLVEWEIVEYIGAAGGPNEFIVRGQELLTYVSTSNTANGTAVVGVASNAKVLAWITSQAGGPSYPDTLSHTTWDTVNQWVTCTRDRNSSVSAKISYAAVEYTGSNWTVQRVTHTYTTAGVAETTAISDVGAISRAFVHAQLISNATNNYDYSAQVWLATTGAVSFQIDSLAATATKTSVAWVLSNSQTGTGAMNVTRYTGTFATDGVTNVTVTAVADLTQSSVMEFTQTNTQNTGSPGRDQCSYRLTSTTNALLTHIGLAGTTTYRFATTEWPSAVTGAATSSGFIPLAMQGTVPNDARYRAMRTMAAYSSTNPAAPSIATIYFRRTFDLGNASGVGSRRAIH